MGDQHNRDRYGELWDQERIAVCLGEIEALKDGVILSGGWAWHFMSPIGHKELKHAHDHKDIDIFVNPLDVSRVCSSLKRRGFERVWTRYDRLPSKEDFRRYELLHGKTRVVVDFFVKDVPSIDVQGFQVVEPRTLLSLYRNIHSSDKCFAVQAASRLIAAGENPVGRSELVEIPQGSR